MKRRSSLRILLVCLTLVFAGLIAPKAEAASGFSVSTSGSYVYGSYGVSGSTTWISGYVVDTADDGGAAYALIHFTFDCCSIKVTAIGGPGAKKYFYYTSTTPGTAIRVKAGAQNWPWWDVQSPWKYLYP